MIGLNIPMPAECGNCDFCTSDGECMAMSGDSLWEYLPDGAIYFPNGWKHENCPLIEIDSPENLGKQVEK